MRSNVIIESILTKVKAVLQNHADPLNQNLTAENAEIVTKTIKMAVAEAAAAGFKTYIELNEIQENTIIIDGMKYQFNRGAIPTWLGLVEKPSGCFCGLSCRSRATVCSKLFYLLDAVHNMGKQAKFFRCRLFKP